MDNYRKRQTVYPDGTIRRVRQGEGRRQPPPPTDKTKYNYAQRINYDGYYNGGGYNGARQMPIADGRTDLRAATRKLKQNSDRTMSRQTTRTRADDLRYHLDDRENSAANLRRRVSPNASHERPSVPNPYQYNNGTVRRPAAPSPYPYPNRQNAMGANAPVPRNQQKRAPQKPAPKKQRRVKNEPVRQTGEWVLPEGGNFYAVNPREAAPRQDVRRPRPTPEEIERRRREAAKRAIESRERLEKEKAEKKKRRKKAVKNFFIRLAVFFVLTALIVFWYYNSTFNASGDGGTDTKYTFITADEEGEEVRLEYSAKKSAAYANGILYMNFTKAADWFDISYVGSVGSMRYIIPTEDTGDSAGAGDEQYIIFNENSRFADVNGAGVIMEGVCRVVSNEIWVPLSFIENYVDGVKTEKSGKGKVVFEKSGDEKDSEMTLTLRLKRQDIINPIAYPER